MRATRHGHRRQRQQAARTLRRGARVETMATEDAASGGSVVVAEARSDGAPRASARWEAFQRTRDDERARGRERWAPPARARDERYPRDPRRGRCRPFLDRAGRVSRPPHRLRAFTPRPSAAAASDADADDDPRCRICFSGAEAGRLFAPCHCRGTMRHVHVACLDAWRNASARANNASYHACDQCGFRYRTERGAWASFLEDPKTADRLAWTAVAAAVTLAGTLSRAVSTRALVPLVARVARALRRAPVRYGFEETPTFRRLLARGCARRASLRRMIGEARSRSTPRARRGPSRALSSGTPRFHLPASRRVCVLPPRRVDRSGAAGGTPQAQAMAHQSRDVRRRARLSRRRRGHRRRGGVRLETMSRVSRQRAVRAFRLGAHREVTASAPVDFFSSAAPRSRAPPRASRGRAANHARRSRDSASAS